MYILFNQIKFNPIQNFQLNYICILSYKHSLDKVRVVQHQRVYGQLRNCKSDFFE